MTVDYDSVKCYRGGLTMILKTRHGKDEYVWIEKGNRAALTVHRKLLWWGEVGDPKRLIPPDVAPLEVLLEFSRRRLTES